LSENLFYIFKKSYFKLKKSTALSTAHAYPRH
jgi:hypothetical protein